MFFSSHSISNLLENIPLSILLLTFLALSATAYYVTTTLTHQRPWPNIPVVSLPDQSPLDSWIRHGRKVVERGTEIHKGRPFQVITGTGPKIVLPNGFADELKAHPNLNFNKSIAKEFFSHYPGFGAFQSGVKNQGFLPEVLRVKLTPSMGLIINDLVEENTKAIPTVFGEDTEWRSTFIKQDMLDLVARLSSRVFLGSELCNDPKWLDIARNYTVVVFTAAQRLRAVPSLVRPVLVWFLEPCKKLRRYVRDAYILITPEVERRKERVRDALARGEKSPKTADAIGWMYELGREKREMLDYVKIQLSLFFASIHTTSGDLTASILDLVAHPEYIQPLREEAIEVIGKEGWSKTSLYKLKLLDSFLKESQRLHPPRTATLNRMVEHPITLSDGTLLPKGARILTATSYTNPTIYANPSVFDPYRFLRERSKPGQENSWQHVSLAPEHLAFGYGDHACPGRFFASTLMKITMVFLLVRYDWEAVGEGGSGFFEFESTQASRPDCRVRVRRRREEVELGGVGGEKTGVN